MLSAGILSTFGLFEGNLLALYFLLSGFFLLSLVSFARHMWIANRELL